MSVLRKFFCFTLLVTVTALSGCGGGASDASGTLSLAVVAPADSTQPGTATANYAAASGKNTTTANSAADSRKPLIQFVSGLSAISLFAFTIAH